ncbi:hypothetical protein GUJ93_ZPchr0007g4301 [Zizania palustris]|uniref:Uncharacterized protein n=1 Tax=Zizania palustris TaxID=103762 RepID=A0A8J5STE3_ZIZPA|nr:hypothetical protein GUJ93_ZPchr0007g3178 [Zizania palustris]KAG8081242.1 hypothetical protein GUJ93_ZPchr0007g4301 [Zizania palustris]
MEFVLDQLSGDLSRLNETAAACGSLRRRSSSFPPPRFILRLRSRWTKPRREEIVGGCRSVAGSAYEEIAQLSE